MKAQFFIVSVIILALTIVSLVNLMSLPEAIKATFDTNKLDFFMDTLSSTTKNIYSIWHDPLLSNKFRISLTNYECGGGYSTFSVDRDFPDNIVPKTIRVFGDVGGSTQVVWEDIETREGSVYWPILFSGCESKDYFIYYNLVGEGDIESEKESLVSYIETSSEITINTTKYKAVIDKNNGGVISELYIKGSSSDRVTSIQSIYRCNGTSYEQDSDGGPEIEVAEAGPIMITVKVRANHGISPRESFTQLITFLYDRIVIEESSNLLETIYCSGANPHTYGHLVDPSGSPIYETGGEWVDFDFSGDGFGSLINSSLFVSTSNSSSYSYFNALDQTSFSGKKSYKLTIFPRWGDEKTTSNQSSFLSNIDYEVGAITTKQEAINHFKTALSDAIGRFGYNIFLSSEEKGIVQNYSSGLDWYYQSRLDYYMPVSVDKDGYGELNNNWSEIQGTYPVLVGYIDDNSFRLKRFDSDGMFLNEIPTYSSKFERVFENMNNSDFWTRVSNNTETGVSSNKDILRIFLNASTTNSYAWYNYSINGTSYDYIQLRYKHDSSSFVEIYQINSSGTFFVCYLTSKISFSDSKCQFSNELLGVMIGLNKTGAADNEVHSLYIDWMRIFKDNSSLIFDTETSGTYRLYFNTWIDEECRTFPSCDSDHSPYSSVNVILGSVTKKSITGDFPTSRSIFYMDSERKLSWWPFDLWFESNNTLTDNYIGITDEYGVLLPTQYVEKNGSEYKIAFSATIDGSNKFYLYYDLNQTINFDFETDLIYNNNSKTVENSYFYWDFDDNIFKYKDSDDWFVTDQWRSSNGTHTTYSLSNWEFLDAGPARVRAQAQALNIIYNITIFAYNKMILIEPSGPENITFGPVWSINGDADSIGYFNGESFSLPKEGDYKDMSLRRYVYFGKKDSSTGLIVFVEKDKAFPSSSTVQIGSNYVYVGVIGDENPKVYLMPDDFLYWDYNSVREDLETRTRFSENVFVFSSILSGRDLTIESEKI